MTTKIDTWRIDAPGQTLVLVSDGGVPVAHYWGAALPASQALNEVEVIAARDVTGGMIDRLPNVSLCPEAGQSFPGQAGLVAYRDRQPLYPRFKLIEARIVFRQPLLKISRVILTIVRGDNAWNLTKLIG